MSAAPLIPRRQHEAIEELRDEVIERFTAHRDGYIKGWRTAMTWHAPCLYVPLGIVIGVCGVMLGAHFYAS